MFKTTCFDIWRQEKAMPRILTICKELDDRLGGGIPAGIITEFCGGPGCGKTQMCLQLCINVQFPKSVGGLQGKAIYLDTNQDFSPTRLQEMSVYTEKRFRRAQHKSNSDTLTQTAFTVSSIMGGVTYIYCKNYLTLQAAIEQLRNMLNEDRAIKLIVVDSFSFPLRVIENVAERTSTIYTLLTELQELAKEYQVVVILTNELTTRVNGNDWTICPALGDSHTHKINQRIILSRCIEQKCYVALVEKSNIVPQVAIPFVLKQNGVRDIP